MIELDKWKRLLAGGTAIAMLAGGLHPAFAQDADEDDELLDEETEEVIVTGSRIRRSEFTSASPIQVISGQISREAGLFDTAEMLQSSAQAAGLQIDNTFNSFVLDNGPGAATIGFRGIGSERTLVLINGRRMVPAGAGGAPTSTDLNLIPSILIDRIENLFDGASTVYGSDAIAGVSNVILKRDIEGLQLTGNLAQTEHGGADTYQVGALWGKTWDNGFINISAEYNKRTELRFNQRDFTNDCNRVISQTESGEIISDRRGLAPGTTPSSCKLSTTNRVFIPFVLGNIWYTGGETNIGIDNFSDTTGPLGFGGAFGIPGWTPVDTDGDGIFDADLIDPDGNGQTEIDLQDPFFNFNRSETSGTADLLADLERYSIFTSGEYNLNDDNNTTLFFEGIYARRESNIFQPGAQVFPSVPGSNPFNICNFSSPFGNDCLSYTGFTSPQFGIGVDDWAVTPILNIAGDRDATKAVAEVYRIVGGVRGSMGWAGLDSWSYEAFASFGKSKATDLRKGINDANLRHSLDTSVLNPDGSVTCGNGSDGCVPVNLFAPSLFIEGGGTFATQAETDYLFLERRIETNVEMLNISGFMTGDVFSLPWNEEAVPLVVGYEFRRDSIATDVGAAASEGLLFGFFSDGGADGSRVLHEFFAETELPLLRGQRMAEELTFTASARYTDESFFDPAWTYSLKGIYRPTKWLTFRGTYGTSYRAPNLRERFLNGTSGFRTVSDPCAVPIAARIADPLNIGGDDIYDPTQDNRSERLKAGCATNGVNPQTLGLDGYGPFVSAEVVTGGATDVVEETSTSSTYGFVFEQPFTDKLSIKFSATWFEINVRDSISEPSVGFIFGQCYDNITNPEGDKVFCDRIGRDGETKLDTVDTSFLNIGLITSKGLDLNLLYQQDFEVGGKNIGVSLDLKAVNLKEQNTRNGDSFFVNGGSPESPHWRGSANLRVSYDEFTLNWFARWIQGGENTPDDFSATNSACLGTGELCRPVFFTPNYDVHNASITWNRDNWAVTLGVRNVFDKEPPLVDSAGVLSVRNAAIGSGYDFLGRTVFLAAGYEF